MFLEARYLQGFKRIFPSEIDFENNWHGSRYDPLTDFWGAPRLGSLTGDGVPLCNA
jgi:hypothetical protein